MSNSRIIRGPAAGAPASPAPQSGSRGRVIRGNSVGIPVPLSVRRPDRNAQVEEIVQEEIPPPDFTELREAAQQEGYQDGYQQGLAQGLADAEAQMAGSMARLAELAAHAVQDHADFYRGAERQVLDLIVEVAKKVVEREVEHVPDLVVDVVRAALQEMDARTAVRVRVSPDDMELLRRQWANVVPPSIAPDRIELVEDPRVTAGAVIETTYGLVDAQLDTKLAQLQSALSTFSLGSEEEAESILGPSTGS